MGKNNELRITIVVKGWKSGHIINHVADPKKYMDAQPVRQERKYVKRTIEIERTCQYPSFKGIKRGKNHETVLPRNHRGVTWFGYNGNCGTML